MKRVKKYCRSRRKDTVRYVIECYYRIECWLLDMLKRGYEDMKVRRTADKAAKLRNTAQSYAKAVARALPEIEDPEKRRLLEEMLVLLDNVEHYFSYMEYAQRRIVSETGEIVNVVRRRVKRLEKLLDYTRFEHCWCIRIPDVLTENGYVRDKRRFSKLLKLISIYIRGVLSPDDFELILMNMLHRGELGRFEFIPINKALNIDETVLKDIFIKNIIGELEKMYGQLSEREIGKLRKRLSKYPAIRLEALWYSIEYFRLSGDEFVRRFLASEYLGKL